MGTGLTERRVWESMKEGKTLQDIREIVPDEWHDWLKNTFQKIRSDFYITSANINTDYWIVIMDMENLYPEGWTRKDFALRVKDMYYKDFMFNMLDRKDITDRIYDLIKPSIE